MTMGEWAMMAGISLASLVISAAFAGWVLLRLPADYFMPAARARAKGRSLGIKILKNLLGGVVVAVGLFLSIPGVPGQGALTILAGLILMDFPGKYRLERKILSLGPVCGAVNRLRAWRGRPPLEFPVG